MDLSKLSDEELDQLEASAKQAPAPASSVDAKSPPAMPSAGPDLSHLSDAELDELETKASDKANRHDLVPYLKQAGGAAWDQAKAAGSGLLNAVSHPADTASQIGAAAKDAVMHPGETAKGVYRAVRSVPLIGNAVNDAVAGAHGIAADIGEIAHGGNDGQVGQRAEQQFLKEQEEDDAEHAAKHPLTDFVQKSLGYALPVGVAAQTAGASIDAFKESIKAGNTPLQAMQDARNTATLFGLAHGAGEWASAAKAPLADAAGYLGKKGAKVLTGVNPSSIERYVANPAGVNAAPELLDTTKSLLEHTQANRGVQSGESGQSFETLKNSGVRAQPSDFTAPIQAGIENLQEKGAVGAPRKAAISDLESTLKDVQTLVDQDGTLSLDRGKTILGVIDARIRALRATPGTEAQILKSYDIARDGIDSYLKTNVPEYGEQMAKLSQDTQTLKGVTDTFSTPKTALAKLKQIQSGKAPFEAEALDRYDQRNNSNFKDQLADSYAKNDFTRNTTNGSRKAVTYGAAGAALGNYLLPGAGGFVGGAIGGGVGALADVYGGQVVKGALDAGIKVGKLAGTPYAKTIMEAAKTGPQALAVAHYTLSQRDPEYQRLQNEGDH